MNTDNTQDGAEPSPASAGSHVGLRDYFAAAALTSGPAGLNDDNLAKWCYRMADAMLRARDAGPT
jgi:hypothetical protein